MTGARHLTGGRGSIAVDLIGVLGLAALAGGLAVLRGSDQLGFDLGAAIDGVASQLAVTLPAAALVLGASGLELGAGLILARLLRRTPFDSLAEAAVAALVATTLKGSLLIGLLAGFGLYRGIVLVAVDVAIIVSGRWVPFGPRVGRLLAAGWVSRLRYRGSIPVAALVGVVCAGPILLQLASPVVPFIDVLPNYVGPAEHLRTFGWLSPLTETQSPIIGPSRSVLGYDALVGGVATMTNLPAVLATGAYILPSMVLVLAGVQRLARGMVGPDVPVGPWALVAFAVTEPFARLADARGTVIALPMLCFALALTVEAFRGAPARSMAEPSLEPAADVDRLEPWRPRRGLAIGLGLAAAILVHPVMGAFAVVTVGILALVRPRQLAPDAAIAGLTAGIIALPQLGVMLGKPVPTLVLAAAVIAGLLVAIAAAREVERRPDLRGRVVALARAARLVVILLLALGLAAAVSAGLVLPSRLGPGLATAGQLLLDACGILLVALALGWVVGSAGARSVVIYVATIVGLGAVVVTQMLPGSLGFLGDALRFEVPKTVQYWIPVFVAVGAGAALAKAVSNVPRPHAIAGAALVPIAAGAIVVFAAYPLRTGPIDAYHLGEHRLSEAVAIDLHYAGSGFWVGFPDSRSIVDPPRREIVDFIRAEIDAGRIGHDTPVLHVARSFQEWVATPLGVFDGVTETFASPDQEVSHQTVGGRLYNLNDLPALIDGRTYPYVVLEPAGLPAVGAIRSRIIAAGYHSIFANGQGEVFALGS